MPEKNMEEFKQGFDQFIHDLEVIRKEDDYKYSRDQLIMILKDLNSDFIVGTMNKGCIREIINILLRERNLKRCEISINKMLDFLVTSARPKDGYVNGVEMCKAGKKNIEEWYSLESTKELITKVSEREFVFENTHVIQGQFLHPNLGIKLAIWISDAFSKQVDKWIDQIVSTNSVRIFPDKRNEIIDGLLHFLIFLETEDETDEYEYSDEETKFIGAKNIFKDGSCIYVISDMSDKIKKYKVRFSRDINNKLYKEKIFTPNFKLEFLTYSNCNEFIEKMVNLRYLKNSKTFMGSNWIYGIDISHITESIKFIINFGNYTYNIEPNISKYKEI
jgi:hypothetical protein